MIARLTAGPSGDPGLPETAHRRFGDVAAGVGMLQRLDAITVIDSVVGAALSGGVSVATYLGLAALNRVCEPKEQGLRAQVEAGVRRLVGGHRRQMIEVFVPAAAAMASATPRPVDDQLIFIGSPLSEMCGMVFQ